MISLLLDLSLAIFFNHLSCALKHPGVHYHPDACEPQGAKALQDLKGFEQQTRSSPAPQESDVKTGPSSTDLMQLNTFIGDLFVLVAQ